MKRRPKSRQNSWSKGQRKPRRRSAASKSLRERILTAGIWAMGLINLVLIVSLLSEFFVSPHETTISINSTPESTHDKITVEVLNACGIQGLANEIGQYLRNSKFDVVDIDNYQGGFNLDRTLVLDRASLSRVNAKKVGKQLGVADSQIVEQIDNSSQLKVTVIIGKDYKKLKVYKAIR
ncbi:MAG: LytR C-terminal domain-containing protein [bacterium]